MKTNTAPKPVWLTTPEEYAAQEVGHWVVIPCDRTDAMLRRGVRKQVTKKAAMAQHRTHIETALELDFPIAVASIAFHGLALPKGYVRNGELYVNRRSQIGRNALNWRQAQTPA
ncbi:MAG: hypothetical protein HY300_20075 [Verrucomicrobia bacterium]|nr:hypothetical protein [Verrucomicrobiota bacterium]